jgi:hypothetical protein
MVTPTEHWLAEQLGQIEAPAIPLAKPDAVIDRVVAARGRRRLRAASALVVGVALLVATPLLSGTVASWWQRTPTVSAATAVTDPEVVREAVIGIQSGEDPAVVAVELTPASQIVVSRHGTLQSTTESGIAAARAKGVAVTVREVPWARQQLLDLATRIQRDDALRAEFSILGADLSPQGVRVFVGEGQARRGPELATRLGTSIPLLLTEGGTAPAGAPS